MNISSHFDFKHISPRGIQICCMWVVAVLEALTLLLGASFYTPTSQFMASILNGAAVCFLTASLLQAIPDSGKKVLLIGGAFSLLLVLLQLSDFLAFRYAAASGPRLLLSAFLCEYLMLLPWAGLVEKNDNFAGFRIFGSCYFISIIALAILAGIQIRGTIPAFLESSLRWHGFQLETIWNPNILGSIFMIGVSLHIVFYFQSKHIWLRLFLILSATAHFYFLMRTASRGAIIATLFILFSLPVILFFQSTRFSKKVKTIAGVIFVLLMTAAVIAGILVLLKINQIVISGGADNNYALYRFSLQNLLSFSNRSDTWRIALQGLCRSPRAFLLGVRDVREFLQESGSELHHAHNSWIQIFLQMGIVGFVFSLYLTWGTLRNCFVLIFRRKANPVRITVCLASVALMLSQFLEPYLFCVEYPYNFFNSFFMLCLGYEYYWIHQPEVSKSSDTGNS